MIGIGGGGGGGDTLEGRGDHLAGDGGRRGACIPKMKSAEMMPPQRRVEQDQIY